jgi:hypothetical protein
MGFTMQLTRMPPSQAGRRAPLRRARTSPGREAEVSGARAPDLAFGRVPVLADVIGRPGASSGRGSNTSAGARTSTGENSDLAITSSGDPTVTIRYSPEAADKSTKIVFIQVVQTSLDGTAVKPGTANANWSHLDADTTGDNYAVDHLSGEADPYYNGDDLGKDTGTQGNATSVSKVDADMTDTPNLSDAGFPAGKTVFKAQFRTMAFSAAGADKGTFYAYAKWSYTKEKGKVSSIAHEGVSTATALPQSRAAINLWCTNHGFALPK